MKTAQSVWTGDKGWTTPLTSLGLAKVQLVLVFGAGNCLNNSELMGEIESAFPAAVITGCSTAGEICADRVYDDSLVVTAVCFDETEVRAVYAEFTDKSELEELAGSLAGKLVSDDLAHILVFSDGLAVNGTELVQGISRSLPSNISVSGGLAGDGPRFEQTFVVCDGKPKQKAILLLGFYSDTLMVGCGSRGGWDPFGPQRLVTRSEGNVLFELDNKSALELYKKYLGEFAEDLPASGLLFPLSLKVGEGSSDELVRTILAVDEEEQSMTFAGDVPEGAYVRFMKASKDSLVDGAQGAAETSLKFTGNTEPELAVCVSCVGRKLVLGQRVEEEVEAVLGQFGSRTAVTGYYSYGELSPIHGMSDCSLHNQTMTVTVFAEKHSL